jgi:hypothetical protein
MRIGVQTKLWMLVGMFWVGLDSSQVSGQSNHYVGEAIPPNNNWNNAARWSLAVTPQPTHDVFLDLVFAGSSITTVMDLPDVNGRAEVNSFSASLGSGQTGALNLKAYADYMDPNQPNCGANRHLRSRGDFLSTAPLNAYTVNVGPSDSVWIGAGFFQLPPPPLPPPFEPLQISNTSHFKWNLEPFNCGGSPQVGVTGTIGPGQWTAKRAYLGIGFHPHPAMGGPIAGAPGVIDSGVTGTPTNTSRWTLEGTYLRGNTARNLDQWVISETPGTASTIQFRRYFESKQTFLSGTSASSFKVSIVGGQAGERGLRVKTSFEMRRPSSAVNMDGPRTECEELLVEANGKIQLERGAYLGVKRIESAVDDAPTGNRFESGSRLLYGLRRSANDVSLTMTLLDLLERAKHAREPKFHLAGQAYMGTPIDPDKLQVGQLQEMEVHSAVHFDVEANTANLPARNWYTGEVDLAVLPTFAGDAACPGECPAAYEVFVPDCCNVFFTNVSEPRCLKYWRTIRLKDDQADVFMDLVDVHDNYQPNPPHGACSPCTEAMYVRESVTAPGFSRIDTNGHPLYYGSFTGAQPPADGYTLIKTKYGDFNGDCAIDGTDYAIIRSHYVSPQPGQPVPLTSYPIGDLDEDCDIDLVEITKVRTLIGQTGLCENDPQNGCCRPQLRCPAWLPYVQSGECACGHVECNRERCPDCECPGSGFVDGNMFASGMISAEDDGALVSTAFIDYLRGTALPDNPIAEGMSEEEADVALAAYQEQSEAAEAVFESVVMENISWLDDHLNASEKEALVAQLSSPGMTFAMCIGPDLAEIAMATLSD